MFEFNSIQEFLVISIERSEWRNLYGKLPSLFSLCRDASLFLRRLWNSVPFRSGIPFRWISNPPERVKAVVIPGPTRNLRKTTCHGKPSDAETSPA